MEYEVRFYFSKSEKENIINKERLKLWNDTGYMQLAKYLKK